MFRMTAYLASVTLTCVFAISFFAFRDLRSVPTILLGESLHLETDTVISSNPEFAIARIHVRNLSAGQLQVQGLTESCFLKSSNKFPINIMPLGTAEIVVAIELDSTHGSAVPVELFVNGQGINLLVDGVELVPTVSTKVEPNGTFSILES